MDQPTFRIFGLDTTFEHESENSATPTTATRSSVFSKNRRQKARPASSLPAEKRVSVRLAELLPLLMEASASNRMWLQDFDDDLVEIPEDLYEVALAYRAMRRAA